MYGSVDACLFLPANIVGESTNLADGEMSTPRQKYPLGEPDFSTFTKWTEVHQLHHGAAADAALIIVRRWAWACDVMPAGRRIVAIGLNLPTTSRSSYGDHVMTG